MLSASEARNTGFSFTAHVRPLCCEFGCFRGINMDFESILEEILLARGQGNLKLKPKQKEALQRSRFFKNCRSYCRYHLHRRRKYFKWFSFNVKLFRRRKKQNFPPHNCTQGEMHMTSPTSENTWFTRLNDVIAIIGWGSLFIIYFYLWTCISISFPS